MSTTSVDLSVSNILGKNSAILHSDGLILFEKLQALDVPEIVLSFEGITYCTTSFLNASIGKFIIENREKKRNITFKITDRDIEDKIALVKANALNEKKRNSLDNSARGFLYA